MAGTTDRASVIEKERGALFSDMTGESKVRKVIGARKGAVDAKIVAQGAVALLRLVQNVWVAVIGFCDVVCKWSGG